LVAFQEFFALLLAPCSREILPAKQARLLWFTARKPNSKVPEQHKITAALEARLQGQEEPLSTWRP